MSGERESSDAGYTLIELLVVISFIGTLLAIAVPRYFQSIERSKEAVLRQDLSVMRQAIDQHRADLGEYPESLAALVAWKDGDLLGYAYAWEQATRERRPPVLVDRGLLPDAR